jgi:trimeric autotransporter adhesin
MRLIGDLVLVGFGQIKNARFENLSSDPAQPVTGQLWFNTVEGVYKGFNGTEVVIIATGGKLGDLQAELDQVELSAGLNADGTYSPATSANYIAQAASLTDADNKLDAALKTANDGLAAEVTRATGAESTLTTNLAAEVSRATGAEGTLTTNLAAEVTRATGAEGQLTTDLASEVSRAQTAEGTLTTNLAAEVSRATSAEGTLTTNLSNEVSRAQGAEATLQANIDAEATAARAAESTLTTNLAAEVTRATGAESTLTTNLAAEVTRATGAEDALNTALTAEVSRAQGAEATLTNGLAAEVTRATGAESAIATNLSNEVTRAQGVEAGIDTRLSAVEGSYINKDGSVAFTGNQSMGGFVLTQVGAPVNDTDAANKAFVLSKIGDLGNAFNYVGIIEGGVDEASAFDLSTLSDISAGDYYRVDVSGYVKDTAAAVPFFVNVKDGVVKNVSATGWDKFDNTDPTVSGTADYVVVTGAADTGFDVDLSPVFKGRLSTAESGLAAEIVRASAAEATLTSDLASEVSRAQAAEAAVQSNLDSEVTRATGAESALTTALGNEVTRAQGAESALTTALGNEVTRATGAETTLQANIDAEATRAQAAESTLTTNLAAEVTRATGAEGTLTTNLAAEVTRAQAAEAAVQTNLDAEVTRAQAAEATLTSGLSAEVSRAQAAESTLTTNLAAEVTRATGAEATLTTDLAAEVSRASGVETSLQAEIDAVEAAAGLNADGTLAAFSSTNFLNAVTTLRAAVLALDVAAKAVDDRLTASQFVYDGTVTPATTHTVAHGLGQKYSNVLVVDANDKVIIPDAITFDSTSQLTVQFISAVTCRVIVFAPKA